MISWIAVHEKKIKKNKMVIRQDILNEKIKSNNAQQEKGTPVPTLLSFCAVT